MLFFFKSLQKTLRNLLINLLMFFRSKKSINVFAVRWSRKKSKWENTCFFKNSNVWKIGVVNFSYVWAPRIKPRLLLKCFFYITSRLLHISFYLMFRQANYYKARREGFAYPFADLSSARPLNRSSIRATFRARVQFAIRRAGAAAKIIYLRFDFAGINVSAAAFCGSFAHGFHYREAR